LELKARLELLRFVLMSGLVGGLVFGSPGAGVAGSIIGLTLWVLLQGGYTKKNHAEIVLLATRFSM
jgi:hypothetical protein